MYEAIKQIIKAVIPSRILKSQERFLRKGFGLFYRGNKHECNICETKLRKFILLKTKDLICPNCGSIPRNRGLWNIIKFELKDQKVLHFSPSPALKKIILRQAKTKEYITTDYEGEFETDQKFNIENLAIEDESFDVIICYHVLEHVQNDIQALKELKRVLKPHGTCYIQTPFKSGAIYEDPSIIKPEDRLKHFGQKDHVRIYSPDGLKERMMEVGFQTEIIEVLNENENYFGFKSRDIIMKSKKSSL